MMTFKSLGLSDNVLRGVLEAGYSSPTEIQTQAIPPAGSGRDLIGCAQTGTGKTAAFVLPMLDRLTASGQNQNGSSDRSHRSRYRPIRSLVVVPTRELAVQIEESVATYGRFVDIRSTAIYGGVGIGPQFRDLKRGVDVVAATPGRLLDHMERGSIDLSRVEILIVDEADRMFDMGFIRDIRKIVADTPRNRQTMLFSATMPGAVRDLAREILSDPVHIEVGERRNPAESVIQQVCMVRQEHKMDLLFHVLNTEPVENVLVFSRTKHRADRIVKKLGQQGFNATVMHSNRSQSQRQRALDGFKNGRFSIMVATDIAARGIDVDGITHVINFDTPNQAEDYIHRIGRTGRADAGGDAITFVSGDEQKQLRDIERHTGQPLSRKVYPEFAGSEGAASSGSDNERSSGGRSGGYSSRGGNGGSGRSNGSGGSGSSRGRNGSSSRGYNGGGSSSGGRNNGASKSGGRNSGGGRGRR
jgi:ATP-dependent RNA helicase RhlE